MSFVALPPLSQSLLHRYFALHKPYDMLSQFIGGDDGLRMLGQIDYNFPEGIHAIGRLDNHSEGLLLLTTNSRVTKLLFESEEKHKRTYLVQVYKNVSQETLLQLNTGVPIRIRGGEYFTTTPCAVSIVERPEWLPASTNELRSSIPSTWLKMDLTEGKYRQIRKMVRSVHHRCMRLVRLSIENIELGDLKQGEVRELDEHSFFNLLNIKNWE